ncbi:hypothetical protein DFJ73DRAFT_756130 [Zopfochytrium polystomum]|nr:hypothetical protein DFJ73DRAFT_756130 [Zopfochytrium polystomum]
MDPSRYVANSNVMVALGVSLITTLVSFWEVIAKLTNPVLLWTLAISATGHLIYTFGSAVIARNVAVDGDLDSFGRAPSILWVADLIAWFSIVFHTTYRTVLIMYPKSKGIWIVPSIILVVQMCLQSTALYYWYDNWTTNHFATTTPQFYWLSLAIMFFVSSIDSVFFVLAQYKIIATLREEGGRFLLNGRFFGSIGQYFYSIDTGK